jgi:RNA polymerase sigma factor (sigma-70 family)
MREDVFTDEQLVAKILKERNNDHFSILFLRYKEKIRAKCYSMTKSNSVSDDLLQDIMLKVMEKLNLFEGRSSFSTWLYAITYNHCIEYLRQNKRIKYEDWAESIEIPEEISEADIENVLELKSERLQLLLEMLKPEDKALILLKYKEDFDLKKIMYILSFSGESATKMRLNRAKKRLVAFYNQFYSALEDK